MDNPIKLKLLILLAIIFIHLSIFLTLSNFKLRNTQPYTPGFFEMEGIEGKGISPGNASSLSYKSKASKSGLTTKTLTANAQEDKKDKLVASETGEPNILADSVKNTDNQQSDTINYNILLYSMQEGGGFGNGSGNGTGSGMQMPLFMDGDYDNFKNWVFKNYNLHTENYKGNVIVEFIVNTNGQISDVEIYNCSNKKIKAEIERIMKLSPRWIPAKLRNRPVNILFKMPINFYGY